MNISWLFRNSEYDKGLYYCKKCYSSFRSKKELEKIQIPSCTNQENALSIMPEKGKNDIVEFKDFHNYQLINHLLLLLILKHAQAI